jgi:hypothetical protein
MREEYLREAHTGSASSQLLPSLSSVPEPVFVNILRSPGIDSQPQATKAGGIESLESPESET